MIPFIKNINFYEWLKFWRKKENKLPSNLEPLVYLRAEFDGSTSDAIFPYIALDWVPTGKCGFDSRCSQTGRGTIFGKFNWSWQNYMALSAGYIRYQERYQFYNSPSENWVPNDLTNSGPHNVSLNTDGLFKFDDKVHQFTAVEQSGDWNMFLFLANNGEGTPIGYDTYNANTVDFYYFKGYEYNEFTGNDELKCDLVPALRKEDNKPGMYDFVSKKFYTSADERIEFNYKKVE